eukprot:GHVH01003671.1.p1 GENE.GHVH01003671.1~~GHVH01003671.1.p1  ORF type:complete len:419 (+),score=68.97 GHVH01003671.1:243-1499(+)
MSDFNAMSMDTANDQQNVLKCHSVSTLSSSTRDSSYEENCDLVSESCECCHSISCGSSSSESETSAIDGTGVSDAIEGSYGGDCVEKKETTPGLFTIAADLVDELPLECGSEFSLSGDLLCPSSDSGEPSEELETDHSGESDCDIRNNDDNVAFQLCPKERGDNQSPYLEFQIGTPCLAGCGPASTAGTADAIPVTSEVFHLSDGSDRSFGRGDETWHSNVTVPSSLGEGGTTSKGVDSDEQARSSDREDLILSEIKAMNVDLHLEIASLRNHHESLVLKNIELSNRLIMLSEGHVTIKEGLKNLSKRSEVVEVNCHGILKRLGESTDWTVDSIRNSISEASRKAADAAELAAEHITSESCALRDLAKQQMMGQEKQVMLFGMFSRMQSQFCEIQILSVLSFIFLIVEFYAVFAQFIS